MDEAFGHFAVRKAGNAYARDVDALPCWCNPIEIALMGTPARPAGHDGFAFGNNVLDRQPKVGEGSAVGVALFFSPSGPRPRSGVEESW